MGVKSKKLHALGAAATARPPYHGRLIKVTRAPFYTVVWTCAHNHQTREAARRCAATERAAREH